MRRVFSVLVVMVAVAIAAPAARADDKEEAERFFRAGESAFNAGQYVVAADAFENAYKLFAAPAIAFTAAQAYRLQYFIDKEPANLKRAVELYRIYISQVDKGGRRDDATKNLAEIEPILLRMEAEGKQIAAPVARTTTRLMVSTQIKGARATIGADEGEAPLLKEVDPGPHKVSVTADGYFPVEQEATAVAGELIVVELELRPKPALVNIKTSGGARISVDGRPMGTAPLSRPLELPAGKHFVTVTSRGSVGWSQEIDVKRGEEVSLDARLHRTGQRKASYWVLGASALSFVGSGVAGLLAISANNKASDIDDKRTTEGITPAELIEYNDFVSMRDSRVNWTIGLAVVGGITATAGLLMYLFDNPRAEAPPMQLGTSSPAEDAATPTISVAPIVTDGGGAGLSLGGSF